MPKYLPSFKKSLQSSVFSLQLRTGFTLVELLVVVSIIAILSVIGIAIFTNTQKAARDARRKADIDAISSAFEVNYVSSTGTYVAVDASKFSSGAVPVDPINTPDYKYYSNAVEIPGSAAPTDSKNYIVCAHLEDTTAGNSSSKTTITTTGPQEFYCRKNQQ